MSFHSWLQDIRSALAPRRGQRDHGRSAAGGLQAATHRLNLEVLEDRCLLSFGPAVSYPVGASPSFVATADFNGDGRLDLATASSNDNSVSVLLGNANGTFQSPLTSTAGAQSLAVGDFNADGKLDLATANWSSEVSVLLGNGDGTFQAPDIINIGASSSSVAVGDFNGDGLLDLGVTSNVYYPADYPYSGNFVGSANVLLGYGNGSFSGPNVTSWGSDRLGMAVAADLNGDGFDDFAAVNIGDGFGSGTLGVTTLLGDSSGYLQGPATASTGYYSHSVAAGDLDADGDTDLVTSNWFGDNVSVLLGNGLGGFASGGNYAAGDSPDSVVLGDFTGDGKVDVATANFDSNNLSLLSGGGDGTLLPAVNFALGSGLNGVAAGDFNGDGWLDAATANPVGNSAAVLINDQSWPSPPPPSPPSVSINDATVTEGNTGTVNATFTLTLSAAYGQNVTVHYATANITAVEGSDYTKVTGGVVVIPAGQISKTLTIAVKGDRLGEPTETFAVNLSAPTNATIGDGRGIGTILDNEPRISIGDFTKAEGKLGKTTLFTFTVTLSAAYDQAVTVSYATANGTATSGSGDYVAKTGTLTFAPGQRTKTITIEVKGDSKKEAHETFFIRLANAVNSYLEDDEALATILNDD